MKKITTTLLLFVAFVLGMSATNNEVKLNLKENSASVKLIYRLANSGDKASVDYGNGETGTLEQGTVGQLMTSEYTFASPSGEARTISIQADKLVVLRIASSKAVNGILSLVSPSLKTLNMDYTKLSTSPKLDFSTCPAIEEITLNECDVEEVILPSNPKVKTFQCSPSLFSTKALKTLDLGNCSSLETLGLKSVALDTVDLRACPNLKQLVLHGLSTKIHPKALLGAKALKNLERVDIQVCALGYDMLPDRNDTSLEQFTVKRILSFAIPPARIKGLSVDLSYLLKSKGISETAQTTTYTWKKLVGGKYEAINTSLIKEADGVFKFDSSLLNEEGKCTVRCYLSNPGYPDIAYFFKTGYATIAITLEKPELAISEDKIELFVKENSSSASFKIIAQKGESVVIDWGNGKSEEIKGEGNTWLTVKHTYDAPLTKLTTIAIDASYLIGYGDVFEDKSIIGFGTIQAPLLERIRHAYYSLKESKNAIIDLTQCPKLQSLSLCNAPGLRLGSHPDLNFMHIMSRPGWDEDSKKIYAAITLDKLDLSVFPKLESVLIDEQFISEINLSDLKVLRYLHYAENGTQYARGLRDLTKGTVLQEIIISFNKLGIDELPPKNPEVTYTNYLIFQYNYPISPEKIAGTKVDLSPLSSVKALDGTPTTTTFTWKKGDKTIDKSAYSEKNGLFIFNTTLFDEGEEEASIYVEIVTPLFSGKELTGYEGKNLRSEAITLKKSDAPAPATSAKISFELPEKVRKEDFTATVDGKAFRSGDEIAVGKTILFALRDVKNEEGSPRYSNVTWSVNGTPAAEGFEYAHKVSADANITLGATVGAKEIAGSNVSIAFVNNGNTLQLSGLSHGERVQLYGMDGRLLLDTYEHRIDTRGLPHGVYIVRTSGMSVKVVK